MIIIDTAGRLHTQDQLMAELAKVRRVIARQLEGAPHETLLTVDATTGQNGVRQARLFSEAVDVTGIVLTKLDGTAKGGIALAIAGELGIPVKLIGIGEQLEDLRPFDPPEFARALSVAVARAGIPSKHDWLGHLDHCRLRAGGGRDAHAELLPRAVRHRRGSGRRAAPGRGHGRLVRRVFLGRLGRCCC